MSQERISFQPPVNPDENREAQAVSVETILQVLAEGQLDVLGTLPWGSNYTFLATVTGDEYELKAVYKPCGGERPLWDFPDGSLCLREMATYLLSQPLGWPLIPPTVLREGPYGLGTVQFFIKADPNIHYFTLRDNPRYLTYFQQIAVFDYIVNNADRKGGHCLRDDRGRIWSIDHGLTFHIEPKLRTVIWEFCEQPIPENILADLRMLRQALQDGVPPLDTLAQLISYREKQVLEQRIGYLLSTRVFPSPTLGRNVPFPPV
ncbi:MAG: SCO1664 family protein [Anaerolineae bacterium]